MPEPVNTTDPVGVEPVKNETQPTTQPSNTEQIALELAEARKKAEQAEMRARQLENEKKEREKADEEARIKQLEEQNQYKDLYEKVNAERESLEQEIKAKNKLDSINLVKGTILADYPSEVIEIANTAGLSLSDETDEAQADFKSKLDAISSKLGPKKIIGNNGMTPPVDESAARAKAITQMRFGDARNRSAARNAVIGSLPALKVMRKNAGLSE